VVCRAVVCDKLEEPVFIDKVGKALASEVVGDVFNCIVKLAGVKAERCTG